MIKTHPHSENNDRLMQTLRTRTAACHEAIGHRLPIREALHSPSSYRHLLEMFYGFYRPIEERLVTCTEWQAFEFNYEERRKLPLLTADLYHLGSSIETLPLCKSLPNLSTFAHALGCLYVLEGSTLGGQQIARLIQETLGLGPASGAAFYHAYGENTGFMWKSFSAFMNDWGNQQPDFEPTVQSAIETFTLLGNWSLLYSPLQKQR